MAQVELQSIFRPLHYSVKLADVRPSIKTMPCILSFIQCKIYHRINYSLIIFLSRSFLFDLNGRISFPNYLLSSCHQFCQKKPVCQFEQSTHKSLDLCSRVIYVDLGGYGRCLFWSLWRLSATDTPWVYN